MTRVSWDKVGERFYETGLDRGVLYLTDGTAIPWNGLVAVDEDAEEDWEPIYFDGVKVRDVRRISEFSGNLRAITFPEEFLRCDGQFSVESGLYAADQGVERFSLSYRTKVGSDLDPEFGYRIHILFNLTAVGEAKENETLSDDDIPVDFAWKFTGIPEDLDGFRPTTHVVIDPREVEPLLLMELENILYGTDTTEPQLPTLDEFYDFVKNWWYITTSDNGDGTVNITSDYAIEWLDAEQTMFRVVGIYTWVDGPGTEDYDPITQTYNISVPALYSRPNSPEDIIP